MIKTATNTRKEITQQLESPKLPEECRYYKNPRNPIWFKILIHTHFENPLFRFELFHFAHLDIQPVAIDRKPYRWDKLKQLPLEISKIMINYYPKADATKQYNFSKTRKSFKGNDEQIDISNHDGEGTRKL